MQPVPASTLLLEGMSDSTLEAAQARVCRCSPRIDACVQTRELRMQWHAQGHFGNTFVRVASCGIITRTSYADFVVKAWRSEGFDSGQLFVSSGDVAT